MNTHKQISKENFSEKIFPLITCKLVILKKLVNNKNLNKKSSSSIDKIAYHCSKTIGFLPALNSLNYCFNVVIHFPRFFVLSVQ